MFIYFIFVLAMFGILLQKRGENIATPPKYIFVFVNEVFDINYTNISVMTKSKSTGDTLCAHTTPWKIPSPLASKCCTGPSKT